MTVTEVAAMVGFPHSQVAEFLRSYGMYRVACNLEAMTDEVRSRVQDPRSWPASTVDRLLDNKHVREWLGIEFDADGNVKGKIKPEEFKKGFARIISDVATEKVTSRTHNTAKEIESYVKSIKPESTPGKTKGSFTAMDLLGKGGAKAASTPSPRKRPTTAKKSRSLVPPGFRCEIRSARINEVFTELKNCRLDTHKNSAGV
ncbi:MAG: hypothetical protein IPJ77_09345, partial [Planctomycetes bacterium]|nr:hypothetical protein [Planctomycetota bacterium]